MALFTGRGDDGTTKTFNGKGRVSKASLVMEALGSLDEVNSFLGLCKIKAGEKGVVVLGSHMAGLLHAVQENLFIIQAELAGAPKSIEKTKVTDAETFIKSVEQALPPIKTFFIAGGIELAALLDVSRTQARRAERKVVAACEAQEVRLSVDTLAYMNRLSSVLYALARFANHAAGISEAPPSYK